MKGLSWEPWTPVPLADFRAVAESLTLDFTNDLDRGALDRFGAACVQVWVAPGNTAMPVLALSPKLGIDNNQLRVAVPLEQQALVELREVGGRLVVDIVCDYLLDVNGLAASSSLALVVGSEAPALPGGLLRLTVIVAR